MLLFIKKQTKRKVEQANLLLCGITTNSTLSFGNPVNTGWPSMLLIKYYYEKNHLLFWGGVAFIGLLILSLLWYQERVVFLDIAYHLFFLLKEHSFAIQNGRFVAAFTQLFPLSGAALGLSINAISLLYSASFILLPTFVFGALLGPLRNPRMALAYLLFVVGMMTHTFFWIQSELPQTMAFLALFAGILERELSREHLSLNFWVSAQILIFTVCFSNPLSPIAFFYLLFFFALRYPQKRGLLVAIGSSFLLIWIVKSLFFRYAYDLTAMSGLKNFKTLFPNYFNLQSNRDLLRYFLHDYYVAAGLLLALAVLYFRRRAWSPLGLLLCFFVGYAALVNISNPKGADQFYMENQYLLLSFFVALPAAYDLFPILKRAVFQQALLGIIIIFCIIRIVLVQPFYHQRLEWNRAVLTQTAALSNTKVILPAEAAPLPVLLMTWGSSYEFWLLSMLDGGPARSVIIEEKAGEFDWALDQNKAFITKWGVFSYAELKGPYFPFTDTGSYVKWPGPTPTK